MSCANRMANSEQPMADLSVSLGRSEKRFRERVHKLDHTVSESRTDPPSRDQWPCVSQRHAAATFVEQDKRLWRGGQLQ